MSDIRAFRNPSRSKTNLAALTNLARVSSPRRERGAALIAVITLRWALGNADPSLIPVQPADWRADQQLDYASFGQPDRRWTANPLYQSDQGGGGVGQRHRR